jgi:transcriptional regulator with XRE-family HTH domain
MARILKAIREAIRQSGKTRYSISKATGIDQAQLSKLMKGNTGLSLDSLERLAEFLELEIVIRPKRQKKG